VVLFEELNQYLFNYYICSCYWVKCKKYYARKRKIFNFCFNQQTSKCYPKINGWHEHTLTFSIWITKYGKIMSVTIQKPISILYKTDTMIYIVLPSFGWICPGKDIDLILQKEPHFTWMVDLDGRLFFYNLY
jgi:hypothetical protein